MPTHPQDARRAYETDTEAPDDFGRNDSLREEFGISYLAGCCGFSRQQQTLRNPNPTCDNRFKYRLPGTGRGRTGNSIVTMPNSLEIQAEQPDRIVAPDL